MADLRSVVYGDKTFTIPQGGDYEARIAALETSVAALSTRLAEYTDVLLQLNGDGSNRTAYDVLGKVHDLRPLNMFEAREGAYDVNGNWLGHIKECNLDSDEPDPDTAILYYNDGSGARIQDVFIDRILTAYPTTKGIVLGYKHEFENAGSIKNATSGVLDWMVVANWSEYGYEGRITSPLFDGGVTDAVGTIYIKDFDMTDAPWGQTNATINTVGTPVPWTE